MLNPSLHEIVFALCHPAGSNPRYILLVLQSKNKSSLPLSCSSPKGFLSLKIIPRKVSYIHCDGGTTCTCGALQWLQGEKKIYAGHIFLRRVLKMLLRAPLTVYKDGPPQK